MEKVNYEDKVDFVDNPTIPSEQKIAAIDMNTIKACVNAVIDVLESKGYVNTEKLADNSVTTTKLSDKSVTGDKLADVVEIREGQKVSYNGTEIDLTNALFIVK